METFLLWKSGLKAKAKQINGKSSNSEWCGGWKPCVPKELLLIWAIVTILMFAIIHFMSQTPYIIPTTLHTISQNQALNFSNIFSHYIPKNYTILQQSPKKLIMIYMIGIEGTGHHFFCELFRNFILYQQRKTNHYQNGTHYYNQITIQNRMVHPKIICMFNSVHSISFLFPK